MTSKDWMNYFLDEMEHFFGGRIPETLKPSGATYQLYRGYVERTYQLQRQHNPHPLYQGTYCYMVREDAKTVLLERGYKVRGDDLYISSASLRKFFKHFIETNFRSASYEGYQALNRFINELGYKKPNHQLVIPDAWKSQGIDWDDFIDNPELTELLRQYILEEQPK
ncbi:hypothetical protein [Vibrio barjaei]|uniref:hypothetical protein n=1 Tax=Vibrio barjaei TaxID=1676683 RepID=UPI002284DAB8|nr:hypothetical protein [Vibrio barjaei]MCY9871807.1 hypothetical protein [Vibrio barjaei]